MSADAPPSLLAEWFRRVWNETDATAIDELAAADVACHGLNGDIDGTAAWRTDFYAPMLHAFSAFHVQVLHEHVSGEMIYGRLIATLTPVSTGEPASMAGTCQMRIAEGKIAETWDTWDFLGLLEGLNLLPRGSFGLALAGKLRVPV